MFRPDTPDTPDDGLRPETCRVKINKNFLIKGSVHLLEKTITLLQNVRNNKHKTYLFCLD
jgi:hypothetical protein